MTWLDAEISVTWLGAEISVPDLVNGAFELGGGFALMKNVKKIKNDRCVRGVHPLPTAFFMLWGLWNLFYYPHLGQWASVVGGAFLVSVNLVWLCLMVYYWKERR